MTIQELYEWGKENDMLNKEIRVRDVAGNWGYLEEAEKYRTIFDEIVTLLW